MTFVLGFSLETGLVQNREHHTVSTWPETEPAQCLTTTALIIYLLRYYHTTILIFKWNHKGAQLCFVFLFLISISISKSRINCSCIFLIPKKEDRSRNRKAREYIYIHCVYSSRQASHVLRNNLFLLLEGAGDPLCRNSSKCQRGLCSSMTVFLLCFFMFGSFEVILFQVKQEVLPPWVPKRNASGSQCWTCGGWPKNVIRV